MTFDEWYAKYEDTICKVEVSKLFIESVWNAAIVHSFPNPKLYEPKAMSSDYKKQLISLLPGTYHSNHKQCL
jgi:hypothetical protein